MIRRIVPIDIFVTFSRTDTAGTVNCSLEAGSSGSLSAQRAAGSVRWRTFNTTAGRSRRSVAVRIIRTTVIFILDSVAVAVVFAAVVVAAIGGTGLIIIRATIAAIPIGNRIGNATR